MVTFFFHIPSNLTPITCVSSLELVARVSETNAPIDSDCSDSDGSRLPKCLVCDEVMAKGVYLSCRTCAAENEAVVSCPICLRHYLEL